MLCGLYHHTFIMRWQAQMLMHMVPRTEKTSEACGTGRIFGPESQMAGQIWSLN